MAGAQDSRKSGGPYGLEPGADPEAAKPAPPPAGAGEAAPPHREPVTGAEAARQEEPSPIRALDICPNCGSPMGPVDTVVCMRCGFDLKSLKVIKTKTVEESVATAEASAAPKAPPDLLSEPGAGGLWLAAGLAVVSLVVLAIGCVTGAGGLVGGGEQPASAGMRLGALVRVVLRTAILAFSGLGGLYVLAHILRMRLGDVKLAAVRMAGIMAALGLLTFFDVSNQNVEWTVESIGQGLVFVGLAMFFFGLGLRDAVTLLGVTVFAVLSLLLVSGLIQWATVLV